MRKPLFCSGAKNYGRASVTDPPPGACPWKRSAANESSAKASLLWSRMISMSCSKVHLRLVKKLPGHPPAGAIVPSAAPGVAAGVIKQAPLAAASRQRPATSIGGGCGGGGGGGGEAATCSLGGDPSCDVLVHALAAASDRSRPAAIALRLRGRPHMDVIMQRAAHRPAVGLRQNAFGRILYSTHAIAQWRTSRDITAHYELSASNFGGRRYGHRDAI